jgi:hypothetical protein
MQEFRMLKSLCSGVVVVLLGWSAVQAQESGPARTKSASKLRLAGKPPAVVAPAVDADAQLPVLSEAHLALAQRVVLGKVPCELGAYVAVSAHQSAPGRFVLEHGRQKFYMVPVLTSTGAIRLEDVSSGAVWLQLANKSMLMDQKQGRRLADACMNAEQVVVADAMARSPAPNLLEPLPIPPAAVAVPAEPPAGPVRTATN